MAKPDDRRPEEKLRSLKEQILEFDLICSGTLYRRFRKCGKASCRCATDPEARHGPYYQWSRMEGRRQVHTDVPPTFAPRLEQAQRSYQKLRRLLQRWERESLYVLHADRRKIPKN